MRVPSCLLAILLLCLPCRGRALEPDKAFHNYVRGAWSIEEGLPQISALSIVQDQDGYIWVGTQSGLARFDGVRFTNYTPETHPGLPGIWIRSLYLARDGKLWIGTYKGAAVFDGREFTPIPAADLNRWPTLEIYAFTEDAAGRVWAATTGGVFREQAGQLHAVPGSQTLTFSLLARKDGMWVGARGAVYRVIGGRWQVQPLPAGAETATVNRLVETQGRIWAATTLGLFVRNSGGWERSDAAPRLGDAPVDLLYADSHDNLWAAGDLGLARIRNRKATEFMGPESAGGITGLRVAFEDREHNLWLGSQWEGLIRLRDSWTRRFSTPEGLNERITWAVSADPDGKRIWVGGNNGISVLDNGRFALLAKGEDLPHPQGYNLLAEADRLWIGTRQGLAVMEHTGPQAGRVQQPTVFAPLAAAQIHGIVRTDDGDLWIPTAEGLYRLRNNKLQRYAQADGLTDPRVRFFHQTHDRRVLAGTQGGLFEMRGERFFPLGIGDGLPPAVDVTAITQLNDGRLVIGTWLEQTYFSDGRRWHLLGQAQGMPGNTPFFLVEHTGFLWAAGIRGITRVPIADLGEFATGRIKLVRGEMLLNERGDPMSGQKGYCCNGSGNSKGLLRGNTLWLPTRDGIVAMDTQGIVKNRVPPNVVVERVQVRDQWRLAGAVHGKEMPEDSRDLSFEFTVLSLQDPKSVGVDYRLQGYDRDWRQADAMQRSARYTNLPPGAYTLEVRGRNNAGVPALATARLPFSIQPRFHETWSFIGLLSLLLLALVVAGYHMQKHRYRLRQQALELLVRQRTEALEESNVNLEVANRSLEEATFTDPLTGLRNRRYLAGQIPADLAFYDRRVAQGASADEFVVFALADIDHFKSVNDIYGHMVGDLVLKQFAEVLSGLVRTGDYVVRWGGEEFLLVFRPMLARNLAVIGDRLYTTVAKHPFDIGNGRELRVTCSVGLAEYPLFHHRGTQATWETMVELADQALYYVKEHGRNGWAAFRPTDRTNMETMLADLREGAGTMLNEGRLQMVGSKPESETPPN